MIPNLIGTYLCGSKNGKEICYRILDCREMGVKVLKVLLWHEQFVRQRHSIDANIHTDTSKLKSTAKLYVSPTMTNGFELCGVLNANDGLWGLSRLLEAKW